MDTTKQALYEYCTAYTQQRIERIQSRMTSIQESLTSETKSTAGDKHETGRAMLQLEREKTGVQLAEASKIHEILGKIDSSSSATIAKLGSIVYTTQGNYFISISIGQIDLNDTTFFALAANTPLGKLLLGKTAGDTFVFNQKTYCIEAID